MQLVVGPGGAPEHTPPRGHWSSPLKPLSLSIAHSISFLQPTAQQGWWDAADYG